MSNRFNKLSCSISSTNIQKRLRSVWLTALLALGVAFSASAQVLVRPELAKPLQAAQEALKTGQFENAITLAQQALSIPGITPVEKPVIQLTLAVAAMQGKNFPLAVSTLEALLQELPEGAALAQKLPLIESLLSASQQAQDLARVVSWGRTY